MRSVSKTKSSPSSLLGLHDRKGHRLYLTAEERAAFLAAAQHVPREVRTLCVILHDTGCWISEALSLTADRSAWGRESDETRQSTQAPRASSTRA
jgi:integrase/recombinase XerD